MNPASYPPVRRFAALLIGACAGVVSAQTPQTPVATEEAIALSPYEVRVDANDGYYTAEGVSGTRTRTELINLPMNMTVFNEQFIQDIGARDLNDIVLYASGVVQATGGGSATNDGDTLGFTIRGQAAYVPYRNGFRRLRIVDPGTIERTEVVKGPASLLYGLLNPGGTMNYITKRPKPRSFSNLSASVGSYEFYRAVADFNVAVVPKKVSIRLVGTYEDSQSWVARYHNITDVLYPSVTYWYMPGSSITVEYERTRRHINAFKSGLPFNATLNFLDQGYPIDRSWNTHTAGDYSDTDMRVVTAEIIHRFNRNFTIRGSWNDGIWADSVRQNGGNINLTSATSNLLQPRALGYGKRGSWDNYKQAELVNNFELWDIKSQTVLGYQRSSEEFRQTLAVVLPPNQGVQWNVRNPSTWVLSEQTEKDILGIGSNTGLRAENAVESSYVVNQLTFLHDRVHTLLGYRIDKITANNFTPSAAAGQQYSSTGYPAIKTPQAGILFKPTAATSVYAQYSEAAVNLYTALQRRTDGSFFLPKPGRGKGYDIGAKAQLFDNKIIGNISVFAVENTNIVRLLPQQQLPDGSLFTPADQSGTDRSTGVEADLFFHPFKGTQGQLSYANTDAYVKSDVQAATTINGARVLTRQGHRLQNAPKHTFSGWVRQDLGAFGRLKTTYVGGGWHYFSERYFTETFNVINGVLTPPPALSAYVTFDLTAGATFQIGRVRYRAAINAKNIADKVYLVERYHFGAPRTFDFTVSASF